MEKVYISIKEAARILGVTPLTLRNWDKNGKLPAHRHPINNYRVYRNEDLTRIMSGMAHGTRKAAERTTVRRLPVRHIED